MDEIGKVLTQVLENQVKIKETMKNMMHNMSKLKSQFDKKETINREMSQMLLVLGSNEKLEQNKLKYRRASNEFNIILGKANVVVRNLSNDVKCLSKN